MKLRGMLKKWMNSKQFANHASFRIILMWKLVGRLIMNQMFESENETRENYFHLLNTQRFHFKD